MPSYAKRLAGGGISLSDMIMDDQPSQLPFGLEKHVCIHHVKERASTRNVVRPPLIAGVHIMRRRKGHTESLLTKASNTTTMTESVIMSSLRYMLWFTFYYYY